MAPADNTPDFDSMTPEEIMAWMESLAKRQGVNPEELTTSADLEIPEIDPDTVVIDEPGYVPYGEERPPKAETPPPPPQVKPLSPPPPPAWATPPPREEEPPLPLFEDTDIFVRMPQPAQPPREAPPAPEPQPEAERQPEPAQESDAMAWLESLAADQADALFNLDLSSLSAEIEPASAEPAESAGVNPMVWLEDLTRAQGEAPAETAPPAPKPPAEVRDPFEAGVDPMAWLENLARRQGAKDEELTTSEEMVIPIPENPVIDEPGYTPFSFDAPYERKRPEHPEPAESLKLEDPAAWLESLAGSEGFGEAAAEREQAAEAPAPSMNLSDIEQAIASGTVSPEQMQYYLEQQTDRYVEELLSDEGVYDEEAPPVPAELPDWLLEQVGAPPLQDAPQSAGETPQETPPLVEAIGEPAAPDMPDWLKEDIEFQDELEFTNIFADAGEEGETYEPAKATEEATPGFAIEVDASDTWAEAFDMEREQGLDDINNVPDWYVQNLSDPQRIAAVEQLAGAETPPLLDNPLPEETELPAGEPEPLPAWMEAEAAGEGEEEALPAWLQTGGEGVFDEGETLLVAPEGIPDWLREAEADVEPEAIPDWLKESLEEAEAPADFLAAAPIEVITAEPSPEPAPAQPPPAPLPVSATLEEARATAQSGDLDASLTRYETLVRSSAELDQVVDDLSRLARANRSNPVVYRVLGDGLMRQGKLQAALDIYREALNLL